MQDKYDLMRFDSSGAVSSGMFDETWRRFVVKMATGSGKTKVLSLVLAWSFFHKLYEPDSELARNFLVIAPNIIVLDRIYKDFQGLRIFLKDDPVVPKQRLCTATISATISSSLSSSARTRCASLGPPATFF